MARIKNATFAGSPPRDVVGDASIFRRWLANAVGDIALVTDLVTGANGETPITHTGAGNGCQLRLPKAAQHIDSSIVLEGSGIAEQAAYVLAVPVFIPAGEADRYRLEVVMSMPAGVDSYVTVINAAGTTTFGPTAGVTTETGEEASGGASRVSRLQSVVFEVPLTAAGLWFILVSRTVYFDDVDPDGRLVSWTLTHSSAPLTAVSGGNGITLNGGGGAISDPYDAPATFTPSTVHDTYDEEVAIDGPLSAYVLTRLNRHINAMWEYVTGALIPGNATYQNATTWDNSRASFTAEGLLDFPICVVALGSCLVDTSKPSVDDYTDLTPLDGLLYWSVHPTTRTTTVANLTSVDVVLPSFSTSSSALKCAILMNSPSGVANAANWRFTVNTGAGTSAAVAPVQIGSTNLLVATVTAIPFTASAENGMSVRIANTAIGALGVEALDVLGVVLYFDP